MEATLHNFTPEQKLKWWGEGEWVNEADECHFEHNGIKCRVIRIVGFEADGSTFGGHFCGYVQIPENHSWHKADAFEIECDVHYGLTYARIEKNGYWVGFDCAHLTDICPSIEVLRKSSDMFSFDLSKTFKLLNEKCSMNTLLNPTYKNIDFAKGECISLAEQVLQVK